MSAVLQPSETRAPIPVSETTGTSDDSVGAKRFGALWDAGAFAPTDDAGGELSPDQVADLERKAQGGNQVQDPPRTEQVQGAEPAVAAQGQQNDGPEYADLTDYLTQSKIEPESFYKMPVAVTIDGTVQKVPLADLLKGYQQESSYTQKSQQLAEQRRAYETERQQAAQQIQAQFNQAKTLANLAHQQLMGEYQSIDWNKLRATDPTQWAVANQEFNNRAAAIQQHMAQVSQHEQHLQQQQQAELQQKVIPAERERLLQARPEWRDDSQFQVARTQMMDSARKLGFSDAELAQVYDHRYLIALDLASRFLNLQAQTPAAVKRVRTAPLVAQPGTRQARDPQQVVRQQAKERFMKNRLDPRAQEDYFGTLT
ncbi:MAG: hypothetical protein WA804_15915 [Terriglobales bacterium]